MDVLGSGIQLQSPPSTVPGGQVTSGQTHEQLQGSQIQLFIQFSVVMQGVKLSAVVVVTSTDVVVAVVRSEIRKEAIFNYF